MMFDKYVGDLRKLQSQLESFKDNLQLGLNKAMADQPKEVQQSIKDLVSKAIAGELKPDEVDAEIQKIKEQSK